MIKRAFLLVLTLLLPASAFAQDESHWGVAFNFNPKWTSVESFDALWGASTVDIESSDFMIGLARGKTLEGDWSVNYTRKNFKDGSVADDREFYNPNDQSGGECTPGTPGCLMDGPVKTFRDVKMVGIEAIKFIKFANIADRVQIGMNVGGGIGKLSGFVDVVNYSVDFNTQCSNRPPFGCTTTVRQLQESFTVDADGEICEEDGECDNALYVLDNYAIGKVEAAVGVIVAPGLKVRVAGGLHFPGQSVFNLSVVYLFGAN